MFWKAPQPRLSVLDSNYANIIHTNNHLDRNQSNFHNEVIFKHCQNSLKKSTEATGDEEKEVSRPSSSLPRRDSAYLETKFYDSSMNTDQPAAVGGKRCKYLERCIHHNQQVQINIPAHVHPLLPNTAVHLSHGEPSPPLQVAGNHTTTPLDCFKLKFLSD